MEDGGLHAEVIRGPGGAIGDFLVTHPDTAFVAFTGSMEVGLRIIRLAASTPEGAMGVKNVIAEMGGKNAIIVDSDADIAVLIKTAGLWLGPYRTLQSWKNCFAWKSSAC